MEHEISNNIKLLSQRISSELDRIAKEPKSDTNNSDSLVYIGNWQDAIPRSIWVDNELDSKEVRSWGVIRTQAVHGSAVMLSINKLLRETLDYSNATVSRITYVLRLTRWISLCSQMRTERGQFMGNIYAIHDAPLSIFDSIYLDKDYLNFVQQQISHKNKKISKLAESIWQLLDTSVKHDYGFIQNSPSEVIMHSIRLLGGHSEQNSHVYNLNVDENDHVYILNAVENDHVYNLNLDEKIKDINEKQSLEEINEDLEVSDNCHVHNLNMASICSSSSFNKNLNKKTTTTKNFKEIYENESSELVYPKEFNVAERRLAGMYLKNFQQELKQSFLDETAAQIINRRKTNKPIRNPIGYLAWLCNEYGKGNLYLTSFFINHQESGNREKATELSVEKKKQELTRAAKDRAAITAEKHTVNTEAEEIPFTDEEKKQHKDKRWGNLSRSVSGAQRPPE